MNGPNCEHKLPNRFKLLIKLDDKYSSSCRVRPAHRWLVVILFLVRTAHPTQLLYFFTASFSKKMRLIKTTAILRTYRLNYNTIAAIQPNTNNGIL
jgi:hypothetical protein